MFLDVSATMCCVVMAGEDWARAATEVERRMSQLRMDRTALAKAAHLDRKTVDNFLDRAMKPRTSSRGGYEDALGWRWGSLTEVARGGSPTPNEPRVTSIPEAIDAAEELDDADKNALKRHYYGLVQFAEQRKRYEHHVANDLSPPPDPLEGRDPPAQSPHLGMPEPAND